MYTRKAHATLRSGSFDYIIIGTDTAGDNVEIAKIGLLCFGKSCGLLFSSLLFGDLL
jgi:hypothetical protein